MSLIDESKLSLYPSVHIVLMLIGGIVIADWLYADVTAVDWLVALIVCALLLGLLLFIQRGPNLQSLVVHCAFFLLGAALCNFAEGQVREGLPQGETEYEAVVLTQPVVRGKVISCDLAVVSGKMKDRKVKAAILRDTVDNRWQGIHAGRRIRAFSAMEPPTNFMGSTFDYRRWMESHGYSARTFIYYRNWIPVQGGWKGLSRFVQLRLQSLHLRTALMERIAAKGIAGDEYAVVVAMSLGDKSLLSREIRDRYSEAGASHVLAISGMHLGIICGLFSFLGLRRRRNVFLQAVMVAGLWCYAVLTGLSPSVVRACLMLTIYAAGLLFSVAAVPLNTLALAAAIMLVVNPLTLWDVSFQMSFASMVGILLLFQLFYSFLPARFEHPGGEAHAWRREMHPRGNAWARALWSLMAISLSAQLAVAPLSAYYFGRIPCYFLLTNLLVYLLAAFILCGALALMVLGGLPFLQSAAAAIVDISARWLNASLAFVAALPGASISGIHFSTLQVLLVYVAEAAFLTVFFMLTRPWRRNQTDRDDVFLTHHWTITADKDVETYTDNTLKL